MNFIRLYKFQMLDDIFTTYAKESHHLNVLYTYV